VNIFAVERRDEGLIELGEEVVGDFVAVVLDSLDALHLLGHARILRKHFQQSHSSGVDVFSLLGEKVEKALFARQEALQKSGHVMLSPEELR
jgi:hypothetical protein